MKKGTTLIELLMGTFISGIILLAITELYFYSVRSAQQTDFYSGAQKYAATILDVIVRDLRTGVRVVRPVSNPQFPIPLGVEQPPPSGNEERRISFTQDPSPLADRLVYRWVWDQTVQTGTIFWERRDSNETDTSDGAVIPPASLNRVVRFPSQRGLLVRNFEIWASPSQAVIRVTIIDPVRWDPARPERFRVIQSTCVSLRYYN